MKDCIVKVLVVFVLGLLALSRLYAQDTTITIYGKRFAPGVIVKLNGVKIDSVRHDSAQPSRILYVKFPLSLLQSGTIVIAGAKDAGASLTSESGKNVVSVGNPDTPEANYAKDTIVVKPQTSRIAIVSSTSLDTLSTIRLRVPVNSMKDTALRVRFISSMQGVQFLRFTVKNAHFQVYDSTGTTALSMMPIQGTSKLRSFRLRYTPQDTVSKQDTLFVEGLSSSNTVITRKQIPLLGIPINEIRVLAAYTAQSASPFYHYEYDPVLGNFAEATPDSLQNSKEYLQQSLDVLNTQIEHLYDVTPMELQTQFTKTRFTFISEPTLVSYQEQASDSIFKDINALVKNDIGLSPQKIASADIVILLTNTPTTPYKAFANTCEKNTLPKFIVVEAKYARNFIKPISELVFIFEELRAVIEKRQ